jgi:alpha-methylacyl-CoA racemase
MSGPLEGVRVVELAGIGPCPFAAMLLADMGADVLRVDRASAVLAGGDDGGSSWDLLNRGKRSVGVDLKNEAGRDLVLELAARADVLVEGFRPGVAERLGVGPEPCADRNPRLVYGRMTGWGQDGPLAGDVGHDIDYIAIAGVLGAIGRAGERPLPPINLIGDFGGGGMLLAFGVVCALLERERSGQGQVVDAAMVDGAALLSAMVWAFRGLGLWSDTRGTNLLDTGAPFYEVYETADGKHVAVGAIEPPFYAALLEVLGLDPDELPGQMDKDSWPEMKDRFATVIVARTRDEWVERAAGTEACLAPVLAMGEAAVHEHNVARSTFVDVGGRVQPAGAPRFARTPAATPGVPCWPGQGGDEALAEWGIDAATVGDWRSRGAIA